MSSCHTIAESNYLTCPRRTSKVLRAPLHPALSLLVLPSEILHNILKLPNLRAYSCLLSKLRLLTRYLAAHLPSHSEPQHEPLPYQPPPLQDRKNPHLTAPPPPDTGHQLSDRPARSPSLNNTYINRPTSKAHKLGRKDPQGRLSSRLDHDKDGRIMAKILST